MSTDHDLSGHLSHDEFFTRLTALFETRKSKSHGSIYLTQKRLSFQPSTSTSTSNTKTDTDGNATDRPDSALGFDPFDLPSLPPAPVLVRATNGVGTDKDKSGKVRKGKEGKVKISTVVELAELDAFFERYAGVCREGMTALKKREKKKSKKKGGKKESGE